MTQLITATVYGMNYTPWVYSLKMAFPTQGIRVAPPYPGTKMGTYNMYGIILSLFEQGQPEYFTDKSATQIITEANL